MADRERLGWDAWFESRLGGGDALVPARVVEDLGRWCRVRPAPEDEILAELPGRFRAAAVEDRPVAGDWVLLRKEGSTHLVERVLERRTRIVRAASGERAGIQVLAANVDVAFVVESLDRDPSPRRVDRYLVVVRDGGVEPVILLNKADLDPRADDRCAGIRAACPGVPVIATSATADGGMAPALPWLKPGRTVVLLGLSGVGKSSIVNCLAGEAVRKVGETREADRRGRHTTTTRRLVALPGGALLLDTPGLRELALWDDGEGVGDAFADLARIGEGCRFRDCGHDGEPGCAVEEAVARGALDAARLASWRKLEAERRSAAARREIAGRLEEKRRRKELHREIRRFYRGRKRE